MKQQATLRGPAPDDFARLHGHFVEHLGYATIFAWASAAFAAWHAPWVHNIRGLIGQTGRVEATGSYLFALPIVMTLALAMAAGGAGTIRRSQLLRSPHVEFGFAGIVAFGVFCLAIARAAAVAQLGR